jgi:spermidine dehydrogenase
MGESGGERRRYRDERERREAKDGITRRDFLDGAAIGAAGLAAAAAFPGATGSEALAKALKGNQGLPPSYYPPFFDDPYTGEPDQVIRRTIKIDGPPPSHPSQIHSTKGGPGIHTHVEDTREKYDCVIVGGGASGIASAKWYRDRFGPNKRILIIDALPDFGGHSHRNEFHIPNAANGNADVLTLRNGGTVNLDSIGTWGQDGPSGIPGSYGQPALDFLDWAGVDTDTAEKWQGGGASGIPSSFGLYQRLLFPASEFGQDHVIPARNAGPFSGLEPNTAAGWSAFLDRTPYSAGAKQGVIDVQTTDADFLANAPGAPLTQAQKRDYLTSITYKQYLQNHVGIDDEAFYGEYWRGSGSLLGAGGQAVSAADCWILGRPGFPDGVGLGDVDDIQLGGIGRTPFQDSRTTGGNSRAWPDGNTSLLRLALSKMIPNAFPDVDVGDGPARPDQLSILKTQARYDQLDRSSNHVRVRLNATVIKVEPVKGKDHKGYSPVDYVLNHVPGGPQPRSTKRGKHHRHHGHHDHKLEGRRVWGKHVIMACWNRVTAHVVKGLPRRQVEGLCYARKVPLIYGRVGLNNWQAFADSKVASVSPRGTSLFWDSFSVSAGAGFGPNATPGKYYGPTPNQPPSAPAQLTFTVVPNHPDAIPQLFAYSTGQQMLREMSWEDLEDSVIDLIDRTVNKEGGDFDPERDIHDWKINRWSYGYAHELTSTFDPSAYGPVTGQPQFAGRQPFRNVAIANSDSEAFAYTHSAINEAHRAVEDLPNL